MNRKDLAAELGELSIIISKKRNELVLLQQRANQLADEIQACKKPKGIDNGTN